MSCSWADALAETMRARRRHYQGITGRWLVLGSLPGTTGDYNCAVASEQPFTWYVANSPACRRLKATQCSLIVSAGYFTGRICERMRIAFDRPF